MHRKDPGGTADARSIAIPAGQGVSAEEDARSGRFDAVFLTHYAGVYRLLYRIAGTREEAEDLAQETFLRLHQNLHLWDQERFPSAAAQNVRAWLYRVATNLAYNFLRDWQRHERRQRAGGEEATTMGRPPLDPADAAVRSDERACVRRTLASLPERQAQLLLLRHAGLSYRELAAELRVAPASIGTLLARAEAAFEKAYRATSPAGED